jgi:hypothetical protein
VGDRGVGERRVDEAQAGPDLAHAPSRSLERVSDPAVERERAATLPEHEPPVTRRSVTGGWLPPEPLRYLGGRLVREAVARKERAEDEGRRASRRTLAIAKLAPAGLVPIKE